MTADTPVRVKSFSIKPTDIDALEELRKLEAHSELTGISFSFFMIRAIKKLNKELKLK